jgi:nitrate/nitrite transport system substrate-binding protein
VFLLTDARRLMKDMGQNPPTGDGMKKFTIMGREFDPAKAAAYADSFAVKKV